jgi:hypothetical protein
VGFNPKFENLVCNQNGKNDENYFVGLQVFGFSSKCKSPAELAETRRKYKE